MYKLHTFVSAFPIFTKVLGQERLLLKAALAIAMAAMWRSTRGETDAERMAGTFGSKTGLTRTDFTPGDRGLAVWRAALVVWCFVGLPCVCPGGHCVGCDKTHSSPANGAPFEYLPQRSGDDPHPGATAPIHEPLSRLGSVGVGVRAC